MSKISDIERVVMRRVHTVRLLRPIVSPGAFAVLVFALALWGIGREVWVARVFENAPHEGLIALGRFYLSAFEHTRFLVQALALATLAALIYLARETARNVVAVLSPLHA